MKDKIEKIDVAICPKLIETARDFLDMVVRCPGDMLKRGTYAKIENTLGVTYGH